jgi:hypothetical protein
LLIGLDSETALIRPYRMAPPLVCVSFALGDDVELVHRTEARDVVTQMLESDAVFCGHNLAYDMSVFCAEWPEIIPLVFEVYAADRVSDTEIREKLLHIAMGIYRRFERNDGQWVKLGYSLAEVAKRHLSVEIEKEDTWRLRYEELIETPITFWPTEAQEYAMTDAIVPPIIRDKQEQYSEFLEDEYRQTRAAFWLRLMECWGIPVSVEGIRAFAKKTKQKFDAIMEELCAAGLAKKSKAGIYSRNETATRQRMAEVFPGCDLTDGGKAKIDDDNCQRSGDALLKKYGDASSLMKTLSTDVPLLLGVSKTALKRGWTTKEERIERQRRIFADEPIEHDRIFSSFEVLKETGRTGSSDNVQNFPTEQGMRECVEAPPGEVLATADYSGMELRTWSQCCLLMFGKSRMAQALNKGFDPHLMIAANILDISYEEARDDFKQNPKGRVYYPRQTGKVANFGRPGGLGKARLVDYARKSYGVILTEDPEPGSGVMSAAELIDFWHKTWPEGWLWFDEIGKITEDSAPRIRQFFSNRFRGNVSFCDGANSFFQGLAADAAKAAGFLVARACYAESDSPLYGWRIVNFVHDELILSGPDDERAHDAAVELARLMVVGASPFLPDVPPVVEPLLCRRWSKAAKPVYIDGRLKPWDFDVDAAEAVSRFCQNVHKSRHLEAA